MSITVKMNNPSTTGVNAATGNSSLTGSNAASLQSSFLTLLVTQLKSQGPTSPLQNNKLTTQLAQISVMDGTEKLNTTLGSISGQTGNSRPPQASTLISHGVMILGTTILTGKGAEEDAKTTTTPFGTELQQPADKVIITITDGDGKVVRTIDIGGLKAGVHAFTWDGTMTDDTDAPSGSYDVSITASNGGTRLMTQPFRFTLMQDVIRSNGGSTLDLGTYGTTTLSEIRRII